MASYPEMFDALDGLRSRLQELWKGADVAELIDPAFVVDTDSTPPTITVRERLEIIGIISDWEWGEGVRDTSCITDPAKVLVMMWVSPSAYPIVAPKWWLEPGPAGPSLHLSNWWPP